MPTAFALFLSFVLLSLPSALGAEPAPGIESLHRLDRLPVLKRSTKVASQSSYDHTGGNNDGFAGTYSFVRKEKGGLVLFDVKGPGVIHRIWTPTPTDDIVEFYFDGEKTPRLSLPFSDLFSGKHEAFVRPLVGSGAGGFYSYLPIPFAESCKVVIKADSMRFYQINYSTYPKNTQLATFSWPPTEEYLRERKTAQDLFAASGDDVSAYTAVDADSRRVHRSEHKLAPGQSTTVFETDHPGRIVGLRLSPASAFTGKDRGLVLRAYWDGDAQPAINSPVGDLFGYAWGQPACRSLLVGTDDQTDYMYFPMPFDQSARIEILSERTDGEPVEFAAEVVTDPTPRAADEGKFYALWRREDPTSIGKPFTFIETAGRGHLVACFQQSQGFESGTTYFFEGDDQTTIDGELTIHGTGSEDFYNGGWYDIPDRWETQRSFPLSGCLAYQKHLSRSGGYRLMLPDAYAFRESILQTIEHAPTNNDPSNDYCGLAMLYMADRPTCSFELPAAPERRVVDLKKLKYTLWWNTPIYAWSYRDARLERIVEEVGGKKLHILSFQAEGEDEFGPHFICFTCDIPADGRYRVSLAAVEGPRQAMVQLARDGAPVGPAVDFAAQQRRLSEPRELGVLELEEGPNNLFFNMLRSPNGTLKLRLDLYEIVCERID